MLLLLRALTKRPFGLELPADAVRYRRYHAPKGEPKSWSCFRFLGLRDVEAIEEAGGYQGQSTRRQPRRAAALRAQGDAELALGEVVGVGTQRSPPERERSMAIAVQV
jgi:hypothetical protein